MPDEVILTLDLGTTRLKIAAFDRGGELLGQIARRNQEYRDEAGHTWQQADDWWEHCRTGVAELLATTGLDPARIAGISLSGRAGAAVFVDAAGKVIANPWSDARHLDQQRALSQSLLATPAPAYAIALLAKATWLRETDPAKFSRCAHILYAKDFLFFRLTGEAITDPASGPDGEWQPAWLDAAGISREQVSAPRLPWTIGGVLSGDAATALGLRPGTPVCVGAHDGVCANIGAGAIEPGRFALTLGTHAVVRTVMAETPPAGALRFYGFPPDKHIVGGNALMAGRALDWFIDQWFDAPESDRQAVFSRLDADIATTDPGAGGVLFLPWLGGQLSPERLPGLRGGFHGLAISTTRSDMYRAVMEGASFAIKDAFEQVAGWAGPPESVHLTGSGVRSDTWTSMLADILERPLLLSDASSEGRGAAMLCATALGDHANIAEATVKMRGHCRQVAPGAQVSHYREIGDRWRQVAENARQLARQTHT